MRNNDAHKPVAVFEGYYPTAAWGIAAPILKPVKEFRPLRVTVNHIILDSPSRE